ncbi:hypothetical protein [Oceanobacillus locisalsi]|uniref:DUF2157 domain-containing protein n=1 Tax=Oceanobacillus locisalsi TaxID=546107 RepID=A0ABW3NIT3_9BACI
MKDQEKNQLIIQEIVKWKENHLLPEEQCDFLLALYTKGGEIEVTKGKNVWLVISRKLYFVFILATLVSVIFLDYYYDLVWYILAGILSTIFLINMVVYFNIDSKNMSYRYRCLFLFTHFLYVLQLSIYISKAAGLDNYLYLVIILNVTGWMVFGYVRKMRFFYYAGFLLMITLITYVVFLKYVG